MELAFLHLTISAICPFSTTVIKIKSAATEVTAQKTQTPIVAKLIKIKHRYAYIDGICVFIKFAM